MIIGAVTEMFGFFFKIIVVLAALVIGAIFFIGWNYGPDGEYRSKTKIEPETIIDIQIVNGVQTSDTTYVYHFN
jgi:hypothetical protein